MVLHKVHYADAESAADTDGGNPVRRRAEDQPCFYSLCCLSLSLHGLKRALNHRADAHPSSRRTNRIAASQAPPSGRSRAHLRRSPPPVTSCIDAGPSNAAAVVDLTAESQFGDLPTGGVSTSSWFDIKGICATATALRWHRTALPSATLSSTLIDDKRSTDDLF